MRTTNIYDGEIREQCPDVKLKAIKLLLSKCKSLLQVIFLVQ